MIELWFLDNLFNWQWERDGDYDRHFYSWLEYQQKTPQRRKRVEDLDLAEQWFLMLADCVEQEEKILWKLILPLVSFWQRIDFKRESFCFRIDDIIKQFFTH